MEVQRIGPDGSAADWLRKLERRVRSLETAPSGEIVIRGSLTATDPNTGVSTIVGVLPDGSVGFQPFVNDTTPPPVASTPIISAQPGTITVSWDGLFGGSATKPRDFDHLNVVGYKIVNGSDAGRKVVGVIRRMNESVFVTTDVMPVDEEWKFCFESEDYNGNKAAEGPRTALVVMLSIMTDVKITEAMAELDAKNLELDAKAQKGQDDAAAAQAVVDAILASGINLAVNGDFELPLKTPSTGWPIKNLVYIEANAGARSTPNCMRAAPTATTAYAYTDYVDGAKDRTYSLEMWVKLAQSVVDGAGTVGFTLNTISLSGSANSAITVVNAEGIGMAGLNTSTYVKLTAKYTVTQDSTKIRFGPRLTGNGNVYLIDNFKVQDITAAESAMARADQAFNNAVTAADAAGTAQTAADGKNRNWYQTTPPAGTSHKNGDTWFDTDDDNRIYLWNSTTNQWVDFRDKAIAAIDDKADGALSSANGKNTNYYATTAPTDVPAGKLKVGDSWFDTANNYRLMVWSGTAWVTAQDAFLAKQTADAKGRIYTQSTVPPVDARLPQNLWVDISAGVNLAVTKFWDPTANAGAGAWVPVVDGAIVTAQTAAAIDAQTKANAAAAAAINAQAYSLNPSFDDWSGTLPAGYANYGTVGSQTKETTLVRRAPNSLRFSVTDTGMSSGVNFNSVILAHAPNLEYFTVEVALYLVSGALDGSGVLIDWTGMTGGNRATLKFVDAIPNAVTGKWYRVSQVMRRPTGATGTWTSMGGYLMGNYTVIGTAVKELVVDWFNVRPSTAEEILSFGTPAQFTTVNGLANGAQASADGKNKVIYSTSPATGTTDPNDSNRPYRTGDTWFQRDVARPTMVIAQWEYNSGWQTRKVDGMVIANIDAATITVGALTGQQISATALDGKVITGATIQTEVTALRGIKMSSTDFIGYDASGNKNFWLTSTGTLTLKGAITSGSTITGATLTGTGIETTSTPLRGVKIASTGITTYDSSGNMTFKVDAATGLVEAPGLKANSITGDKIAAGTITVTSLSVSDITNFAPSFAESPDDWTLTGGMAIVGTALDSSGSRLQATDNASTAWARGPYKAVKVGETLYGSANVYRAAGATGSMYLRYEFYDKDKVQLLAPDNYTGAPQSSASATGTKFEVTATVPAAAAYARITLPIGAPGVGSNGFYKVSGRRMTSGELIVDGSITSSSITTSGLDAGVIKTGELDTVVLGAKSISVDKLTVTSTDNLIQEADFTKGGASWSLASYFVIDPTGGRKTGTPAGKFIFTTGASVGSYNKPLNIPISGDSSFHLSMWVKPSITIPIGGCYMSATFTSVTGAVTTQNAANAVALTANVWARVSDIVTAPTDAATVSFRPMIKSTTASCNMWVDLCSATRASNGELIVDGTILTQHLKSGTIDASVLKAGTIEGADIKSKTIAVDNLVISSTNNLVVEADFSNGGSSWESKPEISILPTGGRGGVAAMRFKATTASVAVVSYNISNKITVDDDNRFRCSAWVKTNVALSSDKFRLGVRYYQGTVTGTKTLLNNSITSTARNYLVGNNTWQQITSVPTALPANTTAVEFYLQVTMPDTTSIFDVDSVSVTRALDGTLIVDGAITSKSLETNLVLTTNIIAGDETGTHAAMEPTGFRVYAADPSDNVPKEVARLGVAGSDDYFAITQVDGTKVATISQEGVGSFQQMNVEGYDSSTPTAKWGLWYAGQEFADIIDALPRGIVAAAYRSTSSTVNAETTANIPYLRLEADLKAGRVYKVWTSPMRITRTSGSVLTGIKYSTTGLATIASGALTEHIDWDEGNGPAHQELFTVGSDTTVSFLIWMGVAGGSAGFRPAAGYPIRLVVEDVGPMNNQIGNGASLDGTVTPPAAKNTYVKQYGATSWTNYEGDNSTYTYDPGHMYQGLSPVAGVGNLKSIAIFDSAQIQADLSGATINYVRVYMNFTHWYYNAGGSAKIGLHGWSTAPGTFGSVTTVVTSTGWPRPGARWVNIPAGSSSVNWNSFKTGAYKGIGLTGDSTYTTYGIAGKPTIEISYTK